MRGDCDVLGNALLLFVTVSLMTLARASVERGMILGKGTFESMVIEARGVRMWLRDGY
jgi:hypothetical protein